MGIFDISLELSQAARACEGRSFGLSGWGRSFGLSGCFFCFGCEEVYAWACAEAVGEDADEYCGHHGGSYGWCGCVSGLMFEVDEAKDYGCESAGPEPSDKEYC